MLPTYAIWNTIPRKFWDEITQQGLGINIIETDDKYPRFKEHWEIPKSYMNKSEFNGAEKRRLLRTFSHCYLSAIKQSPLASGLTQSLYLDAVEDWYYFKGTVKEKLNPKSTIQSDSERYFREKVKFKDIHWREFNELICALSKTHGFVGSDSRTALRRYKESLVFSIAFTDFVETNPLIKKYFTRLKDHTQDLLQ